MNAALTTNEPGDERTDRGVLFMGIFDAGEVTVFAGPGECSIIIEDGADTVRLLMPRALLSELFGRTGDALKASGESHP